MATSERFAVTLDPQALQARLLTIILRVSAVLGLLVYVPSVYFALKQHLTSVFVVDTIAVSTVVALLFLPRIPHRVRALLLCCISYGLAVVLLVGIGSLSQIYLFGFSIVTTLLLGLRMGIGAALLSSLTILVVGARGAAAPEMAIPGWQFSFTEWLVITLNFTLVNIAMTLAIGVVLSAVSDAWQREIGNRVALDQERTLLRTLIDALPDAVFTKDPTGRFVICNPATAFAFGAGHADELTGKRVFEICPP